MTWTRKARRNNSYTNWIIDVDNMTCADRITGKIMKIKYHTKQDKVYIWVGSGYPKTWAVALSSIRDEYLKRVDEAAEKILLEVDDVDS